MPHLVGLDWLVPHCNTVCRRQKTVRVAIGAIFMARDFDLKLAEVKVRAAMLNHLTRLGIAVTVPVL